MVISSLLLAIAGLLGLAAAPEPGMIANQAHQFTRGPAVPHPPASQPRGLAYLHRRDWLVLYSYDAGRHRSMLSVIDRASGRRVKSVSVRPGTVGGLAIAEHLWLTAHATGNRHYIRRFSLAKLINAPNGAYLAPDAAFPVRASRYAAIYGSDLFVGGQTGLTGQLYRYRLSPTGQVPRSPAAVLDTPAQVTGAVVTPDHILFSRSAGPDQSSLFTIQRRSTGMSSTFLLPSQSEGLTRAGSRVYLAFAAGTRHLKHASLHHLTARVP
ncbi:hypothetical protein [Kribbella deserti]|uniref:Uncharacterized protein n=1 Tax=Kribbella deserti TaxID=1926257 RepID=A0ABV6QIH8_9ACTN